MPTVLDRTPIRQSNKIITKSIFELTKQADPMYKALTDSYVFNLSQELATRFSLTSFVDKSADE
jgi:hypothetical protein